MTEEEAKKNEKFDDLKRLFVELDNSYFEKAQKITTLEITHAYGMAIKEKELEIAEAMVRRKVSKV